MRTFEPIAIVGRSAVLPGALGPQELWTAVAEGRDLISGVPADRWRLPAHHALAAEPTSSSDRSWSDRGGYVQGFDPVFRSEIEADPFAIPTEDILALDPLVHWVLRSCRGALREAGHDGRSDRVGAILGNLSFPSSGLAAFSERVWLGGGAAPAGAVDRAGLPHTDPRDRFMSGLPVLLLGEALGLQGDLFALDAACASSLYAIRFACERLHDRTADLMLAGAVNRADDLFIHVGFCALAALSQTGQSRPFHRQADGLVPGEGAAVFALKRLDDALVAGDRVFGVIRGVGLSNDGRGRGMLAPSQRGQVRALRAAYDESGLTPAQVSLVEAHATGTTVGDATEIATLSEVYAGCEEVPLGSLKSNMGHLITAASGAALLKVLGAIEHGIRPPTLHVQDPSPALLDSPFRLLTQAEPWKTEGPKLAAIDAFGFGGNNGHLAQSVDQGQVAVVHEFESQG